MKRNRRRVHIFKSLTRLIHWGYYLVVVHRFYTNHISFLLLLLLWKVSYCP